MIPIIIIASAIFITAAYAAVIGAPFVPTPKKDVERFLKLVKVREGEKVYDLGCGDGRVLISSAKEGAVAHGVEISLLPFLITYIKRPFLKERDRVKISYQDIWKTNLSDADIVYFWLLPEAMPRLKDKLEKELKKGSRVVSYVWPVNGWEHSVKDEVKERCNLFLYQR